jgi:hypothetical protein
MCASGPRRCCALRAMRGRRLLFRRRRPRPRALTTARARAASRPLDSARGGKRRWTLVNAAARSAGQRALRSPCAPHFCGGPSRDARLTARLAPGSRRFSLCAGSSARRDLSVVTPTPAAGRDRGAAESRDGPVTVSTHCDASERAPREEGGGQQRIRLFSPPRTARDVAAPVLKQMATCPRGRAARRLVVTPARGRRRGRDGADRALPVQPSAAQVPIARGEGPGGLLRSCGPRSSVCVARGGPPASGGVGCAWLERRRGSADGTPKEAVQHAKRAPGGPAPPDGPPTPPEDPPNPQRGKYEDRAGFRDVRGLSERPRARVFAASYVKRRSQRKIRQARPPADKVRRQNERRRQTRRRGRTARPEYRRKGESRGPRRHTSGQRRSRAKKRGGRARDAHGHCIRADLRAQRVARHVARPRGRRANLRRPH